MRGSRHKQGILQNRVVNSKGGNAVINLPTDIPSLRLWLDSSDLSTISSVGVNVNRIEDKSGFDNDAIENSGSRQPNTGTRTLNGLNVIDFSNSNDRLRVIDSLGFMFRGGGTFMIALDIDSFINGRRIFDCQALCRLINVGLQGTTGFRLENRCLTSGGPNSLHRTLENAKLGPQIITVIQDCEFGPEERIHRIRDEDDDLTIVELTEGGGSPSNINDLGILSRRNNSNGRLDAAMAEVLYFDEMLDPVEVQRMEQYLKDKWGI